MSDRSKENDDHAWSAVLIESNRVAIKASSAVRCKGGGGIAEWCDKVLNKMLIHRFKINPSRIKVAISDNLAAMHAGDGGTPSKCIWVDSYRMWYAQFNDTTYSEAKKIF